MWTLLGGEVTGSLAEHHLGDPVHKDRGIRTLPRLFREAVIGTLYHSVCQRMRLRACLAVVGDHLVRDEMIMLGFDDEHVATEGRACAQRPVLFRAHRASAICPILVLCLVGASATPSQYPCRAPARAARATSRV